MKNKDDINNQSLVRALFSSIIYNTKNYWHVLLLFICLSILSKMFKIEQLIFLSVYFWIITCSYINDVRNAMLTNIALAQYNKELDKYKDQIKQTTEAIKAKEIELMDKLKASNFTI